MTKEEWMQQLRDKYYPWMTADQVECLEMLCDLYRGYHHVYGKIRPNGDKGIEINSRHNTFATCDFNTLTRAVVMAHDRCIRFCIEPSGPGMLRLFLHKRHTRMGCSTERHPFLEEQVADIRKEHGGPVWIPPPE